MNIARAVASRFISRPRRKVRERSQYANVCGLCKEKHLPFELFFPRTIIDAVHRPRESELQAISIDPLDDLASSSSQPLPRSPEG